jgi:hypothetical protein
MAAAAAIASTAEPVIQRFELRFMWWLLRPGEAGSWLGHGEGTELPSAGPERALSGLRP